MTKRRSEFPGLETVALRNGCVERVRYGLPPVEARSADREALGLVHDMMRGAVRHQRAE
jgi:hypothetical protein